MKSIIESIFIPGELEGTRLSDIDIELFQTVRSKSALKKNIRNGLIELNSKPGNSGDYVSAGDEICVYQNNDKKANAQINMAIEVLYEDEYLAVVNKPAGILVSGNKRKTLENALKHNLKTSNEVDALEYPEPIHRLDFATSGALLIGKTKKAVIELNQIFENRKIKKKYLAVCIGEISEKGEITSPVEGKKARSTFRILDSRRHGSFKKLNLLELDLHTGRRNQIRIHLASLGNPIYGDQKFSAADIHFKGTGFFLHSLSLDLKHPFTGKEISVKAGPPRKFERLFSSVPKKAPNPSTAKMNPHNSRSESRF